MFRQLSPTDSQNMRQALAEARAACGGGGGVVTTDVGTPKPSPIEQIMRDTKVYQAETYEAWFAVAHSNLPRETHRYANEGRVRKHLVKAVFDTVDVTHRDSVNGSGRYYQAEVVVFPNRAEYQAMLERAFKAGEEALRERLAAKFEEGLQ